MYFVIIAILGRTREGTDETINITFDILRFLHHSHHMLKQRTVADFRGHARRHIQ